MQNNSASGNEALSLLASNSSLSQAFREAIQLPFRPADFRQLLRRDDEQEIGRGLTCDLSNYRSAK